MSSVLPGSHVGQHVRAVQDRHGDLELSRFIGELIRILMSALMDDVLSETRARLGSSEGGRYCR